MSQIMESRGNKFPKPPHPGENDSDLLTLPGRLDQLRGEVERLEDALDQLIGKLEPVISTGEAKWSQYEVAANEDASREDSGSQLSQAVTRITLRLSDLTDRIYRTQQRIDL